MVGDPATTWDAAVGDDGTHHWRVFSKLLVAKWDDRPSNWLDNLVRAERPVPIPTAAARRCGSHRTTTTTIP